MQVIKLIKCEQCGSVKSFSPNKVKRNMHFFCSMACKNKFRWGGNRTFKMSCVRCQKPAGQKCLARLKDRPLSFCSRECYGKWRSEVLVGRNSPSWRHGYKEKYYKQLTSKIWRKTANSIRERDGHCCVKCGKKQKTGRSFDVHHIDRSKGDVDTNLITVCRQCHKLLHL